MFYVASGRSFRVIFCYIGFWSCRFGRIDRFFKGLRKKVKDIRITF